MFTSETLANDRHQDRLRQAQEGRLARQAAELRRLERQTQRAERKLRHAGQRAHELRTTLEAAG
jgi:hypothetical protein